jgi:hypothetical protein
MEFGPVSFMLLSNDSVFLNEVSDLILIIPFQSFDISLMEMGHFHFE